MIGIIFDCDGTLTDSEYLHLASWDTALRKRGRSLTEEEYLSLAGTSGDYIAEKLYDGAKDDSAEALFADKRRAYGELQKKGIPLRENVVQFAKELAEKKHKLGIKMGLASAATRMEILINLQHLGMKDVFDAVVSGGDDLSEYTDPEGVNKPKPYIYLHTAKLLGLEPHRCVAIEDSHTGVVAAKEAGMVTFAVPNAFTKGHDFKRADFIIDPTAHIDVRDFFQKIHKMIAKKENSRVLRKGF